MYKLLHDITELNRSSGTAVYMSPQNTAPTWGTVPEFPLQKEPLPFEDETSLSSLRKGFGTRLLPYYRMRIQQSPARVEDLNHCDLVQFIEKKDMTKLYVGILNQQNNGQLTEEMGVDLVAHAIIKGDLDIVNLLVEGFKLPLFSPISTFEGDATTLHLAATKPSLRIFVRVLEECPKNSSLVTRSLRNVYHYAAMTGRVYMLHYMRHRGLNGLHDRDSKGYTPVVYAAMYGHLKLVQYLCQHDPQCIQELREATVIDRKRSVLHHAAMRGYLKMFEYLLTIGADINGIDVDGQRVVDVAKIHRRKAIVRLIERGHSSSYLSDYVWPWMVGVVATVSAFWYSCSQVSSPGSVGILMLVFLGLAAAVRAWFLISTRSSSETKSGGGCAKSCCSSTKDGRKQRSLDNVLDEETVKKEEKKDTLENGRHSVFLYYWYTSAIIYFIVYWTAIRPWMLEGGWVLSFWSILVIFCGIFVVQIMNYVSDPGIVPIDTTDYFRTAELGDPDNEFADGYDFCATCLSRRPLRSKHDRMLSDRCVSRYDHYCVWTGTIIGETNHGIFLVFLWYNVVCFSIAGFLGIMYILGQSDPGFLNFLYTAAFVQPLFGFLILHSIFAVYAIGKIGVGQVEQLLVNVTTNEGLNGHRYPYAFIPIPGTPNFVNIYNRGRVPNLLEFLNRAPFRMRWMTTYRKAYLDSLAGDL